MCAQTLGGKASAKGNLKGAAKGKGKGHSRKRRVPPRLARPSLLSERPFKKRKRAAPASATSAAASVRADDVTRGRAKIDKGSDVKDTEKANEGKNGNENDDGEDCHGDEGDVSDAERQKEANAIRRKLEFGSVAVGAGLSGAQLAAAGASAVARSVRDSPAKFNCQVPDGGSGSGSSSGIATGSAFGSASAGGAAFGSDVGSGSGSRDSRVGLASKAGLLDSISGPAAASLLASPFPVGQQPVAIPCHTEALAGLVCVFRAVCRFLLSILLVPLRRNLCSERARSSTPSPPRSNAPNTPPTAGALCCAADTFSWSTAISGPVASLAILCGSAVCVLWRFRPRLLRRNTWKPRTADVSQKLALDLQWRQATSLVAFRVSHPRCTSFADADSDEPDSLLPKLLHGPAPPMPLPVGRTKCRIDPHKKKLGINGRCKTKFTHHKTAPNTPSATPLTGQQAAPWPSARPLACLT